MQQILPNEHFTAAKDNFDIEARAGIPGNRVHLITAAATLALAKEQRIANLIELAKLAGYREFGVLGRAAHLELNKIMLSTSE